MSDKIEMTPSAKVAMLSQRITAMLKVLGDRGECRSCKAPGYWCRTKTGKRILYQDDGKAHFAECPDADEWRGTGKR